ncbi:hypothetical protein L228DRAFT_242427 [Xylona heveae TC161]|uniref:Uncharacterized protein n=1 Tax=Xylona heveae (strain CBS 132557 / TC161) TaxID=1328760 RepID=A0A165JC31_XYLHT|nr:hypothetical protein L228DRAFT_242427 [Xylona heveae TC161]KZF26035.1 hypothetical protein L228DRAFT_242427 [Xylona heveae TC161]
MSTVTSVDPHVSPPFSFLSPFFLLSFYLYHPKQPNVSSPSCPPLLLSKSKAQPTPPTHNPRLNPPETKPHNPRYHD